MASSSEHYPRAVNAIYSVLSKKRGNKETKVADERKSDRLNLIACLDLVELQLHRIVFEQKDRFRNEFVEDFPGPWDEVKRRFEAAREQIRSDELDWRYVEGVGLTKSHLLWKRKLLEKAGRLGVLRRFLSMANSFLGSLVGALPVLEFVKEYKEMVEASLKIVRSVE